MENHQGASGEESSHLPLESAPRVGGEISPKPAVPESTNEGGDRGSMSGGSRDHVAIGGNRGDVTLPRPMYGVSPTGGFGTAGSCSFPGLQQLTPHTLPTNYHFRVSVSYCSDNKNTLFQFQTIILKICEFRCCPLPRAAHEPDALRISDIAWGSQG